MKYYTLTIESNIFDDMYFGENGEITPNHSDMLAFGEETKSKIDEELVLKYLKHNHKEEPHIDSLTVNIIFEEADLNIMSEKIERFGKTYYGFPYAHANEIRKLELKKEELDIKYSNLDYEITEMKEELDDIETEITAIENRISKLKKDKVCGI